MTDHVAHRLPTPLSSLVGRERDLEDVESALASARLLTLTGTGGVGKTRIAIEAAARSAADFPDGLWWLDLALLSDTGVIESTLAQALEVRPLPGQTELDAATRFLAGRRALLVVDNCEHVAGRVAPVAEALLRECPSLSLLATSRVPLAVSGETRWAVSALSLPDSESLDAVLASEAGRLFVDRASRVDRSWSASEGNAPAIARICAQLDGIPLALELATARVAVLSPEAIADGLDASLALLTTRSRTGDARHRSLAGSLDWSYGLLPRDACTLLRRLGIFVGGTTLELAREVCPDGDLDAAGLLAVLETLVENSLVETDAGGRVVRYRLLQPVRKYALERLEDAGERAIVADRHRDALLALAERRRAEALTPRQPAVLAALDPEAANLAAAFDRALETDAAKALQLCLALDFWYRARARFREADDAFARALAATDPPPALHARALAAWAWVVGNWGGFERANALAADATARAEEAGDDGAIAVTLLVLANHRFFTDPVAALELLHRSRTLGDRVGDEYIAARAEALIRGTAWFQQDEPACTAGAEALQERLERVGDRETLAWFWFEQGAVRYPQGAHAEAAELLHRAVEAAAEIGEPTADRGARTHLALLEVAAGRAEPALEAMLAIEARTLVHGGSFALPWIELFVAQAEAACDRLGSARARLLGLVEAGAWGAAHALAWASAELAEVLRLLGEDAAAASHAGQANRRARDLGNPWLAAKAQLTLGRLAARQERWGDAERLHHGALATIWEHGYRLELPGAFEALAELAAGLGRPADAARLVGAAGRARRELGFVAWPAQRAEVDALVGRLGGGPEFDAALAQGAGLDSDAAVAWLRRARGARKRPSRGWHSLTPTELEVVRLAADGLTNPQIGERLFITRATVKAHLSHVYDKLALRNRSQLAAAATARMARADGSSKSARWPM